MSNINVLIAVDVVVAKKLRDNFTRIDPNDDNSGTIRNDLTHAQKKKLRMAYSGGWKTAAFGGTTYKVLDFHFPTRTISKTDPKLYWLEKFKQLLPGKEFVIGAWHPKTGAQYGTTIVSAIYDENGDIVTPETITGTPVYPIHARVLDIMPNGVWEDVHLLEGHPARRV